jgi:selenide,water dikinase
MGPGDLQAVLGDLRREEHPDLLVGLGRSDDAAVYRVTDDVAIVETVDFFPPIVDDPYLFGAIAAANSMSDVYAMGGQVLFALNVAGFPRELPKDIIAAIFRGGADKVHEAGGVIAGGHTVVDAEPKYGLCVTGRVDPRRILIKGGLRAGQRVFLSKPLGTGVIATAAKNDKCEPAVLDGAVQSMLRLNRVAARVAQEAGATGATDITGFGLLGHASEMVAASGAGLTIRSQDLPLLPGARVLADLGGWSGGMGRNRRYLEEVFGRLRIDPAVPDAMVNLLCESETSGGLLFAVDPARADAVREAFASAREPVWEIGEVTAEPRLALA